MDTNYVYENANLTINCDTSLTLDVMPAATLISSGHIRILGLDSFTIWSGKTSHGVSY